MFRERPVYTEPIRYLRQLRRDTFSKESSDHAYHAWRQSLPWSDEQIAQALEAEAAALDDPFLVRRLHHNAAWVRQGHLSLKVLSVAIGRLITTCAICGKKALYRVGNEGRCSTHRLVKEQHAEAHKRRKDAAIGDFRATKRDVDDHLLHMQGLKATARNHRRRRS